MRRYKETGRYKETRRCEEMRRRQEMRCVGGNPPGLNNPWPDPDTPWPRVSETLLRPPRGLPSPPLRMVKLLVIYW